jgi:hypothetical protein
MPLEAYFLTLLSLCEYKNISLLLKGREYGRSLVHIIACDSMIEWRNDLNGCNALVFMIFFGHWA